MTEFPQYSEGRTYGFWSQNHGENGVSADGYYHCSVDSVGRARGRSVVAAAAYRAGESLTDNRTGLTHDYRRRGGVLDSFIVTPAQVPAWALDRESLWNAAEAAETRANGRLATELELALPHEFSAEQRRELVDGFARELVDTYGVAVDVALHVPGEGRDHRNHHAHLLVSQRAIGRVGFGQVAYPHRVRKKIKGEYRHVEVAGLAALTTDVSRLRMQWAAHVNAAYARSGLDIRVDPRSHRERGLKSEPTQHMGPSATAMERRGERSERGDVNRRIRDGNQERAGLDDEAEDIAATIIDLQRERERRFGPDQARRTDGGRRSSGEILARLTERRSVFTWRDLYRELAKGMSDPVESCRLTDAILAMPEVVGLRESTSEPVSHYTTREVLETERRVLRDASALASHLALQARLKAVDASLKGLALNAEQIAAVRQGCGPEGLAVVAGEAGTGKSRTLGAIRRAYEASGYTVTGLSWTNSVVQDMRRDGFTNASTIASELMRVDRQQRVWGPRDVLIVDEAAMLSTRSLGAVLENARAAGAKVILAGDERQLASIERGGLFEPLRRTHGAAELHIVQRVQDPEQRRAFNLMHEGDFAAALRIFDEKRAIRWSETREESATSLRDQYAADIAADPDKKRFIFAYTNNQVDELNIFARNVQRDRGALAEDKPIETARGLIPIAQGDRVQFTENAWTREEKDRGLVNGAVGTVVEIGEGTRPRMTVELDAGIGEEPRRVSFNVGPDHRRGEFDGLRHGYAGTIYKGQGRTLDQTYVMHTEHWREASSYVALTRHREAVAIFADNETTPDLDRLARQMGRAETKRAAITFITDEGARYEDEPFVEPRESENDYPQSHGPASEHARSADNLKQVHEYNRHLEELDASIQAEPERSRGR